MLSEALLMLRLACAVIVIIAAFEINELSGYCNRKAVYSVASIYVSGIDLSIRS